MAAARGDSVGQFCLAMHIKRGDGVTKDLGMAAQLLLQAADNHHVQAMYNLGVMHHNGQGMPKDHEAARHWYKKASDKVSPSVGHSACACACACVRVLLRARRPG